MSEYLELGPTPYDEDCAQVGSPDYKIRARGECIRYRDGLRRIYPEGDFRIKNFDHDFGAYMVVVAWYQSQIHDEIDKRERLAAFAAEATSIPTWGELERRAKEEERNYPL